MAFPLHSGTIGPTPAGAAGGTPDPHAASHANGGTDEVALDGSQITTGVTGTGDVVKATSPTLVTPLLGTPTSGTLTNCTAPASIITSGTLVHERGGLEADVSAYSGLVKISGGATSQAVAGTDYGRYEGWIWQPVTSTTLVDSARRYYAAFTASTGLAVTANRLYLHSLHAPAYSLYSLAVYVSTGIGSAGVRLGIWATGSDGAPSGAALAQSGVLDGDGTPAWCEFVLSSPLALTPGKHYWLGFCSNAAITVRAVASSTGGHFSSSSTGHRASTIATFSAKGAYVAHTFGTLPSDPSGLTEADSLPAIYAAFS